MKICFMIPRAYPVLNPEVKSVIGGSEVQLTALGKTLANSYTDEIHFMTADFGQPKQEERFGIQIHKTFDFQDNIFSKIIKFCRVLWKMKADIYIHTTLTEFSGIIAILCRLMGKKLVFIVSSDMDVDGTSPHLQSFIQKKLSELLFKYCHHFIAQNDYQAKKLYEKGHSSLIIPSFYKMSSTHYSEKKGEFHLWVARSMRLKRAEKFIELAKKCPSEKFVMICQQSAETTDEYYQELKNTAQLIENLEFISFVPFGKMEEYYQKAKTFINTSTNEGFPTTFIEAGLNSTPIFTLNINPSQFLDKYECGKCVQENLETLKNELEKLRLNPELYHTLSKNSFHYAHERHDLKQNATKFYNFLRKKVKN